MIDENGNDWREHRKFIVEELVRNRQVHDQIISKMDKLEEWLVRKECVERKELSAVEDRILEVEKMIENFKGRFYVLAAGIGIAGAIVSRLLSFMLEHGRMTP